jgi:hypothetical protein
MLSLINILILFFTILVIYQIFLAVFEDNLIEGLTNNDQKKYRPYNKNDALILAQQNAGNIIVLKQQIDALSGVKNDINDLNTNYAGLQSQVTSLVNAQNDYTNQMTGGSEVQITGTTDDTTTDDTTTSDNLVTN